MLNVIYEQDFLGFSYGFRSGRGQHDALDALAVGINRRKVNWVLDADIRDYFSKLDHSWLEKFLEHRIADKRVLRLIQKWLRAGVIEDGNFKCRALAGALLTHCAYVHSRACGGNLWRGEDRLLRLSALRRSRVVIDGRESKAPDGPTQLVRLIRVWRCVESRCSCPKVPVCDSAHVKNMRRLCADGNTRAGGRCSGQRGISGSDDMAGAHGRRTEDVRCPRF